MASIYVVDDSEKTCQLMCKILKSAGHAVRTETDPAQAIDFLLDIQDPNLVSVIFLDVMMPKISGHQLLKKIKENEQLKDIPVIFLTSKDDTAVMMKTYEDGAEYFMTKPTSKNQLLYAVNNVLTKEEVKIYEI